MFAVSEQLSANGRACVGISWIPKVFFGLDYDDIGYQPDFDANYYFEKKTK